jgi:hypothetical protein
MPKGTLSFKLPEENEEYLMAIKAAAYWAALTDMDNYLRGRLKYEDLPEAVDKALQEARDYLTSITPRDVHE